MTPAAGSWPEPRPQQLVTGDRAIQLLDTVSSAALQKAGVKLATVSKTTYQKLVDELIPEVFEGLDPDTGKLKSDVLPAHLTPAAIQDVDIRGIDGKIEEQYLPTRLTVDALDATLAGLNSTKTETDPDGVPVILATDTGTNVNDNWTVTGTSTLSDADIADGHADNFTATVMDVVSLEVDTTNFVEQASTPGNPASGQYKVYFDTTQRPIYKGNLGIERRFSTKRHVTAWPTSGLYLGDEAILTTTGEHRIYLGATKGWRLASPLQVASVAERDALTAPYAGMRVFVDNGHPQEHVYRGGAWHGTESFVVAGGTIASTSAVNDGNFRRWSSTTITDPGYPYYIRASIALRVNLGGVNQIVDVWTSMVDPNGSSNLYTFNKWLGFPGPNTTTVPNSVHANLAPITGTAQTGDRLVVVDWRVRGNKANASSDNYQATNTYWVMPA